MEDARFNVNHKCGIATFLDMLKLFPNRVIVSIQGPTHTSLKLKSNQVNGRLVCFLLSLLPYHMVIICIHSTMRDALAFCVDSYLVKTI